MLAHFGFHFGHGGAAGFGAVLLVIAGIALVALLWTWPGRKGGDK